MKIESSSTSGVCRITKQAIVALSCRCSASMEENEVSLTRESIGKSQIANGSVQTSMQDPQYLLILHIACACVARKRREPRRALSPMAIRPSNGRDKSGRNPLRRSERLQIRPKTDSLRSFASSYFESRRRSTHNDVFIGYLLTSA